MSHILIITTSQSLIPTSQEPTGIWLEELTTPYAMFQQAGHRVTLASIKGGRPPIAPGSDGDDVADKESVMEFLQDKKAQSEFATTLTLAQAALLNPDAIFLPGGHGCMWDLPNDELLGPQLSKWFAQGKALAAVCHGPAGLVNVVSANGESILKNRTVCAFTNEEEEAIGMTTNSPFLLEERFKSMGANFVGAPKFTAHAVRDGRLVTGQNPASSRRTAALLLEVLSENKS
jgi:putative intracellular protease/amidase